MHEARVPETSIDTPRDHAYSFLTRSAVPQVLQLGHAVPSDFDNSLRAVSVQERADTVKWPVLNA